MAQFDYVTIDAAGRRHTGRLDAVSRDDALRRLNESGAFPIDVVEAGSGALAKAGRTGRGREPRASDITLLLREIALLLQAGLPLDKALAAVAADAGSPRLQTIAGRLNAAIAGGQPFSDALAGEPKSFSAGLVGMVHAAESTGRLPTTLNQIADERQREERLRAKIISSLTYPLLLVGTAIIVVLVMLLVIVPQFRRNLADAGQTTRTQAMVWSDWLIDHLGLIALSAGGLLIVATTVLLQPGVRRAARDAALRIPIVGTLLRHALTVRFCRTLSLLLSNGVRLPEALAHVRETMTHDSARRLVDQLIDNLRQGGELEAPLMAANVFPPIVTSMFRVGADGPSLAGAAARLADMYEWKLETGLQRFVALLEPTIILVVSLFIGLIVLSIVQSIFGVYDLVGAGT